MTKRYPRRSSLYAVGDRVRFTKVAYDAGLAVDDGRSPLTGTVRGYGRMVGHIRVQRDGRKGVEEYHHDFWEKIPRRKLRRQRSPNRDKR
jgi:hypothetical protein